MTRIRQILGLATISVLLAGCVPQEKYEGLKLERDRLAEQLGKSQSETDQAKAEAAAYKQQMGGVLGASTNRDSIITNLTSQNADLQKQLDELNGKYTDAMALTAKMGTGTALPTPLSNELSSLAAQNPDVLDFDAARGIVKFKSDVTFDAGSAVVLPKAKDVLTRFSRILDSASAGSYELLVAGHTDNTPVHNPETIRQGNKDNWYLSAHRAISVGHELIADGVSAKRLGVVGYADERPIASNATLSGKAQNRRVEVLILPTSAHGSAEADATGGSSTVVRTHRKSAAAAPAPVEMNKDGATASYRPGMNK